MNKMSTLKTMFSFLGAMLIAFTGFSQSDNDEILGNVENPSKYTMIQLAQMDRDLSTFMNLVALSDLGASWKLADGEFTAMIPTNDAFDEMEIERWNHLTNPENRADLIRFVKYHFIPKKVMKNDLEDNMIIDTGVDEQIAISLDDTFGTAFIGGAKVIKADVEASDGVIHIVNGIVQPNTDFMMIN